MVNQMVWTVACGIAAALTSTMVYLYVDIIHRGGPVMVPILMCSVFAFTIVIERVYYFLTLGDASEFLGHLRRLVQQRHWKDVEALCTATKGPVARVVRAGLGVR